MHSLVDCVSIEREGLTIITQCYHEQYELSGMSVGWLSSPESVLGCARFVWPGVPCTVQGVIFQNW